MGSCSPSACWQASIAAGLVCEPPEPSRMTQTSPGMSRIRTKTSAAAPTSVGMASRSRVTTYRYICRLLVQPDIREVLVQVVAGTDLPAAHVGPLGNDAEPVRCDDAVGHRVERVDLVGAHGGTLRLGIALVQHLVVKLDRLGIVVVAVALRIDRLRQVFAGVERRIDDALAVGVDHDVETAAAHSLEP